MINFDILSELSNKMTVIWDVAPLRLVDRQSEDEDSSCLTNRGKATIHQIKRNDVQ